MEDASVLEVRLTVMFCAIEALIAEHPRPVELRKTFDQLFDQVLAGLIASGASRDEVSLARKIVEKWFENRPFSPP